MTELTYQDVIGILRLIDSGPFSDVELEFEGTRLKVTRSRDDVPATVRPASLPRPAAPPPAPPPAANAVAPATAPATPRRAPADVPDGAKVASPMAGTFYAAPAPGAPPFAEEGRAVRKGDQLGIVEVMKLFTPIQAPCDGVVAAILVRNEEVVEIEQTLMVIGPA
jgi:acetyl-CoA carboxylase biotin carboxyl carrier protein